MICLSFDIDWAHDAVIADTLDLVEAHGEKASWFVTHETPILSEIRDAGGHELGLHPNFNPLIEGSKPGQAYDILNRLKQIVPDAVSIRSHSLVRSSRLSVMFQELGMTHESNFLLPPQLGTQIAAWRDFTGLVQVPIRWEDDLRLLDVSLGEPVDRIRGFPLFVVDFHPIHIFLNTKTIDDYEGARADFQAPEKLLDRRRPQGSGGSRDRLIKMLEAAKTHHIDSCLLGEVSVEAGG